MSGRRVIFVNRVFAPDESATAQLLADLAGALRQRGWHVAVITATPGAGVIADVTVHRLDGAARGGRLRRYLTFLGAARRTLRGLVRPGDVVVLKTDPPLLAAVCTGPARRRGARVVQWIQDIYPEIVVAHAGAPAGVPLAPLRWWRNRAWRAADRCVVVGADMRAPVLAAGVPAGRLAVAPNWAPRELDTPAPPAAVAARRAAWGVADRFVVAYSGNLGRVHEFATVLGAAAALRDRPEIVFLFVGDGPRLGEVRAAVQARGLANVRFLPPQPRAGLAAALAAADAHLVTLLPRFAPFVSPSKLAGALAAGRPVIWVGPTDGATAALIRAERCGAVVAPGADAALAELLRRWQEDAPGVAALGHAARAAYARQFTLATAADAWERQLRLVASEGGLRRAGQVGRWGEPSG